MMLNLNIRDIKLENKKNNRHTKHRRVARPGLKMGVNFQTSILMIVWTFIRNSVWHMTPALFLHGLLFVIHSIAKELIDGYTVPNGGILLLFTVYAICLFFTIRKISDHMAYFNVKTLVTHYNINQKTIAIINQSANPKHDKAFIMMDHYRTRVNRFSLFPSVKELAVEDQMYKNAYKSGSQAMKTNAEARRLRLDLEAKHAEHIAAKRIADWKQSEFGGLNEYYELVKKYSHRTIPAVRDIISDVKN